MADVEFPDVSKYSKRLDESLKKLDEEQRKLGRKPVPAGANPLKNLEDSISSLNQKTFSDYSTFANIKATLDSGGFSSAKKTQNFATDPFEEVTKRLQKEAKSAQASVREAINNNFQERFNSTSEVQQVEPLTKEVNTIPQTLPVLPQNAPVMPVSVALKPEPERNEPIKEIPQNNSEQVAKLAALEAALAASEQGQVAAANALGNANEVKGLEEIPTPKPKLSQIMQTQAAAEQQIKEKPAVNDNDSANLQPSQTEPEIPSDQPLEKPAELITETKANEKELNQPQQLEQENMQPELNSNNNSIQLEPSQPVVQYVNQQGFVVQPQFQDQFGNYVDELGYSLTAVAVQETQLAQPIQSSLANIATQQPVQQPVFQNPQPLQTQAFNQPSELSSVQNPEHQPAVQNAPSSSSSLANLAKTEKDPDADEKNSKKEEQKGRN